MHEPKERPMSRTLAASVEEMFGEVYTQRNRALWGAITCLEGMNCGEMAYEEPCIRFLKALASFLDGESLLAKSEIAYNLRKLYVQEPWKHSLPLREALTLVAINLSTEFFSLDALFHLLEASISTMHDLLLTQCDKNNGTEVQEILDRETAHKQSVLAAIISLERIPPRALSTQQLHDLMWKWKLCKYHQVSECAAALSRHLHTKQTE
jgi:hypothetical protein